MRIGKRICSLLVVLAMLFTVLPAESLPAATAEKDAIRTVIEVNPTGETSVQEARMLTGEKAVLKLPGVKGKVKWKSSNKKVVKVKGKKAKGNLKAQKAGTCVITAKVKNTKEVYTWNITVTPAGKIALSETEITVAEGNDHWLSLDYADASKINWTSKNNSVASVDAAGLVKGLSSGSTEVTAKYKGKTYACSVTVKPDTGAKVADVAEEARTDTAGKNKEAVVGNMAADGYDMTVPKGAFDNNCTVETKAETVSAREVRLSASVQGLDYTRLQEPAVIRVALNGPVPEEELDNWVAVYYASNAEYTVSLDREQLRKGIAEFETYHFCDFSVEKVSDAEKARLWALAEAMDSVSLDVQQEIVEGAVETVFETAVEKLNLGKTKTGKVLKLLAKSGKLYKLGRAAAAGDDALFCEQATDLILDQLVDEEVKDYIVNRAGNIPAVMENLGKGDYKGAVREVLKSAVSNIPVVKYTQMAATICQAGIDYWADWEMEAAYQNYYGIASEGNFGFQSSSAAGWDYVETTSRAWVDDQYIRGYKEYAEVAGYKNYSELTAKEREQVQLSVKKTLIANFEARKNQDNEIKARAAETERIIAAFDKEGLLDRGDTTIGFDQNMDLGKHLNSLMSVRKSILGIMEGTDFATLENSGLGSDMSAAQKESLNNRKMAEFVRIWMEASRAEGENGETYGGAAGFDAVTKELAKRYGFGLYLSSDEIELSVGDTQELFLVGADDSEVRFSCDNKRIASIDKDGYVHGNSPGETWIHASYGLKNYGCKIIVTSIGLSPSSVKLTVPDQAQMVYLIKNKGTDTEQTLPLSDSNWTLSDEDGCLSPKSKAKEDGGFSLIPQKDGTATLSASYEGETYTCYITVELSNFYVSPSSVTFKDPAEKADIYLCDLNGNRQDTRNLWKIPENDIIETSYTADGGVHVEPLSSGTVTISLIWNDLNVYKCTITVDFAGDIALSETSIELFEKGESKTIYLYQTDIISGSQEKLEPETCFSEDEEVAKVKIGKDNGLVITAVDEGSTEVGVTYDGKEYVCKVEVKLGDVDISEEEITIEGIGNTHTLYILQNGKKMEIEKAGKVDNDSYEMFPDWNYNAAIIAPTDGKYGVEVTAQEAGTVRVAIMYDSVIYYCIVHVVADAVVIDVGAKYTIWYPSYIADDWGAEPYGKKAGWAEIGINPVGGAFLDEVLDMYGPELEWSASSDRIRLYRPGNSVGVSAVVPHDIGAFTITMKYKGQAYLFKFPALTASPGYFFVSDTWSIDGPVKDGTSETWRKATEDEIRAGKYACVTASVEYNMDKQEWTDFQGYGGHEVSD